MAFSGSNGPMSGTTLEKRKRNLLPLGSTGLWAIGTVQIQGIERGKCPVG
jgi:hypothetical protein